PRGQRLSCLDQRADSRLEARRVADHAKTDGVLVELGHFLLERPQEKLHQDRYLVGWTPPVLAREREQRQEFDLALDARAHRRAHRLDSLAMPGNARQQTLLRPAAVAVHDDR